MNDELMLEEQTVALRKESVDRNRWWVEGDRFFYYVALRKESVDRNTGVSTHCKAFSWSLSARRAWIEMVLEAGGSR